MVKGVNSSVNFYLIFLAASLFDLKAISPSR